ncbi:leucyl/phenylalanyl-tRNA--protein transferase [Qipengyuania sp. RANM35]|uniref:leucyl/phenylalanyl-tRNA--protein transferase n=1 Tax=Qipengyuania sp. RANM35 TaxID=3068635 RepID=UPI0034DB4300
MHAPAAHTIPVDLLLRAYRAGVFPMADHRNDEEVYWVEPRERAIFPLDGLHISQSLRKTIRQNRFQVTCDRDFASVIAACAEPREEHAESWISNRIEASYNALHRAGHAHSIECWEGGRLVGGLYGAAFDRVFCGESMFSRTKDASKVALVWLVAAMRDAGYEVLDCQFMTDHLASLGAVAMPQSAYVSLLASATGSGVGSGAAWGSRGVVGSLPASVSRFASAESPGKSILQSLTQTS